MQVKKNIHPKVKLLILGLDEKVKYHNILFTKSNSKIFIPILFVFSQKHIDGNFSSVIWVMPQGWDLWVLGVIKT